MGVGAAKNEFEAVPQTGNKSLTCFTDAFDTLFRTVLDIWRPQGGSPCRGISHTLITIKADIIPQG